MKNINTRNIINVDRKNPLEIAIFRQDNTNVLEVELFDGRGQALDLTGQEITISARRLSDNAIFEQKTGITITGNKVAASLIAKMCNRISRLDIQFKIKDKKDNSIFTTSSIYVTVERNNISYDSLEDGGYIEILDKIEEEEEQRKANEIVRKSNEEVRKENERIRIENETRRNEQEGLRNTNEQGRIIKESERVNAEIERKKIFNDIVTGSLNSGISSTIEAEVIGARGLFSNLKGRLDNSDDEIAIINNKLGQVADIPTMVRPKRFIVSPSDWVLNSNNGLYEFILNHNFDLDIESVNVRFFSNNDNTLQTYRYIDKNNLKILNDDDGTVDVIIGEYVESNYYSTKETDLMMTDLNSKIGDTNSQLAQKTKIMVNAPNPIVTPTYDGSYQAMHPKILFFKDGWGQGKYQYWMACTPYTGTDDAVENPSILVSRTGDEFMEITNNPIDIPTETEINGGGHMSDTHLVIVNDIMECWYRYNPPKGDGTPNNDIVKIFKKISSDGVNWSDRIEVLSLQNNQFLSPCINYENGKYKLWYVNFGKVYYRESSNGTTWSKDITCNISNVDKSILWHMDIIKSDLGYEMVMSSRDETDIMKFRLYYSKSINGTDWEELKVIIEPTNEYISWDNRCIYRSSIVKIGELYKIYYSAQKSGGQWYIGLTEGYSINSLFGRSGQNFFKDSTFMGNLKLLFSNYIMIGARGENSSLTKLGLSFGDNATSFTRNMVHLVNTGIAGVRLKVMKKLNCLVVRSDNDSSYGTTMTSGHSIVNNTNGNEVNLESSVSKRNTLVVKQSNGVDIGDIEVDLLLTKGVSVDSGIWKSVILASDNNDDTISFKKNGSNAHCNCEMNSINLTFDSVAIAKEGTIAWNKNTHKPMYHNGTTWIDF